MPEFKKILFPVDLSEVSPKLVPHVLEMAQRFQARIFIISVVRSLPHYDGMFLTGPVILEFEAGLIKEAEQKLQEFSEEYFKGIDHQIKVTPGDPAEEILKRVRSEGIDLIIMGTHGRKGLERILFGSVADYVVKNSPVPVMTINPYRSMDEG